MTATKTRKPRRKISPAERERRQKAREATIETMQAKLVEQVEQMATSNGWQEYLDFAASFHTYSFRNAMLILAQHPTATRVAGFRQWQEKGRQVRKGEKAIRIYGFSSRKVNKVDPATGEETEEKVPFFPILSVFAEDQTDPIEGVEQVEDPASRLVGEDTGQIARRATDWIESQGWTVTYEAIPGETNGYCTIDGTKQIVIEETLSPAHAAKTVLHEVAHALLHTTEDSKEMDRPTQEMEAESVAYVVAGALGMDTSEYSVGYVAVWGDGAANKVEATAQRVMVAAKSILSGIDPDED